ncbi:MAG TPA: tripartite tricarboxylate transporter substrate binding protein [Rubrivivax sp.]|nr:tripartite tricarboxylate transporter substrate binding protein [Rubrivivax sp.]
MKPHLTRRDTLALMAASLGGSRAFAQTFPGKTITVVVPYPAGGGTDAVARLFAEQLGRPLGQTMVVDNKAGASGVLGTDAVAKAKPDGHTLLVALSTQFVINPFLFKKLPYDPNKDIALVSQLVVAPIVLLAHPGVPANDAPSMVKYIGANKGKLSYGSYGIGSASHLSGAHLSQIAGGDMNHVPYKGEAPLIQDIIGGQVPMGFTGATQAKAMVDAGRLKAIAVTGEKRLVVLPALKTFGEQGLGDDVFRTVGWMAMAAPGGTPQPVIQRLAAEVKAACAKPEVRERIAAIGYEASGRGPEEFAAIAQADAQVWSRLVKLTGASLD